ncbi:MAG: UDP-N-acetylmuramate--L-alanine ligase [Patescibacteria group bacterium]|nr:UDP-N-acetylmuramate--L-alanine ligase [Patescibacteria group bacterium]
MKIHFIGIGGIGTSALAQYYLARGHKVSGSDLVSSEITEFLAKKGVKIYIGSHKRKRLTYDVKQVVYSPALRKDNAEVLEAEKRKIKIQSYPQILGELTKKYFTIAVCGTHGKSTVTAMVSLILIKAGLDPTVIVGTKLKEFGGSNFRLGKGKYLIIEADEWQASFLRYFPKIIVLTNIEREHLDYYKNLNHILRTYKEFIEHLPRNGVLVANRDDGNVQRMLKSKCQNPNVKSNPKSKCQNLKIVNFSTRQPEVEKIKQVLRIPGEHNVLNALAALKVARILKIPDKISFKALSEYQGSWRRFEIKKIKLPKTYNLKPVTCNLISDYGHHPTEIKATLEAAREKFPNKPIWLIFQPHQYQRTFYLFKEFIKVFQGTGIEKTIITDIFDVAGREEKEIKKKIDSKKLVKKISKPWVIYLPKNKIINYLKKNLKGGEVIIIMGAGDIYKIIEDLK